MKKFIFGALFTACLTAFASVSASADEVMVVTAPVLNVRESATEASDIIGKLEKDDVVTVSESFLNFSKIDFGGQSAYVSADYLAENKDTFQSLVAKYIEEQKTPKYEKVLEYAKSFIGVPYVYGGSTPRGFDCSGFVKYVLQNFGIDMPRVSYEQMRTGQAVSLDEIQPGDLLFFRGGGHVGFYMGDGTYLHAPQSGRTVSIDPLTRDICAARRVF